MPSHRSLQLRSRKHERYPHSQEEKAQKKRTCQAECSEQEWKWRLRLVPPSVLHIFRTVRWYAKAFVREKIYFFPSFPCLNCSANVYQTARFRLLLLVCLFCSFFLLLFSFRLPFLSQILHHHVRLQPLCVNSVNRSTSVKSNQQRISLLSCFSSAHSFSILLFVVFLLLIRPRLFDDWFSGLRHKRLIVFYLFYVLHYLRPPLALCCLRHHHCLFFVLVVVFCTW